MHLHNIFEAEIRKDCYCFIYNDEKKLLVGINKKIIMNYSVLQSK